MRFNCNLITICVYSSPYGVLQKKVISKDYFFVFVDPIKNLSTQWLLKVISAFPIILPLQFSGMFPQCTKIYITCARMYVFSLSIPRSVWPPSCAGVSLRFRFLFNTTSLCVVLTTEVPKSWLSVCAKCPADILASACECINLVSKSMVNCSNALKCKRFFFRASVCRLMFIVHASWMLPPTDAVTSDIHKQIFLRQTTVLSLCRQASVSPWWWHRWWLLDLLYHSMHLRWLNFASVIQNNCIVFIHSKTKAKQEIRFKVRPELHYSERKKCCP